MIVAIPKEIKPGENLVAAIPATVKDLIKKEFTVNVEAGAGASSYYPDEAYKAVGANIVDGPAKLYADADLVLKVDEPIVNESLGKHEVDMMKEGATVISFCQVAKEPDLVKRYNDKKITGLSMHLVPRTTLAQKMDALSSQANIAGYKAVLIGASHIGKYMPLLMTAAGTIPPAKVLVIGAGVAGLQAIATAKRLGSQVESFDVRPAVKEQVESLGAKFVEVAADENDGVGEGGYAKETSDDYKKRQAELMKEHIAKSDLVITTALIPGKPAPKIITAEMVNLMAPGSVIMDLAAENGGNCDYTESGKIVEKNGVFIDGSLNIPSTMPIHASQLYAKNVIALVNYLCKEGKLDLNMEDEIVVGSTFTHDGKSLKE
jgi:H+-translocating NAD(P) transhydrogenase subunit alpha